MKFFYEYLSACERAHLGISIPLNARLMSHFRVKGRFYAQRKFVDTNFFHWHIANFLIKC